MSSFLYIEICLEYLENGKYSFQETISEFGYGTCTIEQLKELTTHGMA